MSISREVNNTFTFKNFQRREVNQTVNGKFYQFCYRMEVGENNMIYSSHNPNAGKDWAKKYNWLEIYSNNINPFQDSPPGIGSSWDIENKNNNYYWDLGTSYCVCPYSSGDRSCPEHNTDWKETQGDKLIYYEGVNGSITLTPLSLFYEYTGYFKPISFKWKEKTGTFKLKIEPAENLTDDVGAINQIDFKFYSAKFQKTMAEIIEKGNYMSLRFNKEKSYHYGYIKRGKSGNKVDWITPYSLHDGFAWEREGEDYQWLKVKEGSKAPIKGKNRSENYENWTKEQLINEIKKLKSEIEELKNNKVLSICSKQTKLKKKQDNLARLEKNLNNKMLDNSANENNFPTGWVVDGGLLFLVGLASVLIIKRRKKRKK